MRFNEKKCGASTINSDKNTMKKLILLSVALSITGSIWAYDFAVGGVYYAISSSFSPYTVEVTHETGGNSYSGTVTIPSSVTYNSISYSVTSIGDYAFALSTGLTSVTIPLSVDSIKTWAFYGCIGLTSIAIPTSVTSIGDGTFWGCTSITNISIPVSVKKIGYYVFFGCTGLTLINTDAANTNFCSANGVLYNKDKTTLLAYPPGKSDVSYTIVSTVDTIGNSAFGYCKNLTSITIPSTVVYITGHAFMQCNGLTSVYIPSSVTFFDNNPFVDCASLAAVNVDPANQYMESVYGVLFSKGLSTIIYYPPAHSGTNYVIPSTVDYVRSSVFLNCIGLTSVTIPSSVTTIRSGMFSGCTGLTSINAYSPTPIDLISANHPEENSDDVFQGVDTTTCVLHVPIGSKSLYASAFQWKGFTNIVEGFNAQTWQTVFYDDFNRADGSLGGNYTIANSSGITQLGILNNEVNVASGFTAHSYWSINYPNGVNTDNIRISCKFRAPNIGYALAINARDNGINTYSAGIMSNTDEIQISSRDYLGNSTKLAGEKANLDISKTYFMEFTLKNADLAFRFVEVGMKDTITINATDNSLTGNMVNLSAYYYSPNLSVYLDDFKIETSNNPTGINNINKNRYSIYPNPATDGFYIGLDGKSASVSIYNLNGMLVMSRSAVDKSLISISTLPRGMYIVKITTDECIVETKLVKK